MEKTHHRDGKQALLRYNVVKGPDLSNPLDPSSKPTGNTCFVLSEVYETPTSSRTTGSGPAPGRISMLFAKWAGSVKVAV